MGQRFEWTGASSAVVEWAADGEYLGGAEEPVSGGALVLMSGDGDGLVVEGSDEELARFGAYVLGVAIGATALRAVAARCEVAEDNPFGDDAEADAARRGLVALRAALGEEVV